MQTDAVHAYIRALRSGEGSAARRAEPFLDETVVLSLGSQQAHGRANVMNHITGNWPDTPVFQMGGWGDPVFNDAIATVEAEFPAFGAGASSGQLIFSFNSSNQIVTISETYTGGKALEPQKEIPLVVRGLINSALSNGTPIVVAYVDEAGVPQLSLRGSTQIFSPTQICIWLRSAEGGLTRALATNPHISLLYRDSKSRSTIIIKGTGHIADDKVLRDRVFNLAPEVEQMHDPDRIGAALIIDVIELRGGTPKGRVTVRP